MATGIKTLFAIHIFPTAARLLLLSALVLSHLHYSAILLTGISENLITTLEKQLNWGIKACFNRSKFDHSKDLKIRHKFLPVRHFLDYKCILYLWKYKNSLSPQIEYSDMTIRSNFLRKCFFKRTIPLWNCYHSSPYSPPFLPLNYVFYQLCCLHCLLKEKCIFILF